MTSNNNKDLINRTITPQIEYWLFKGMVLILYGARQVGKTTIAKQILAKYENSIFIDCELVYFQDILNNANLEKLMEYIGDSKIIVLDEAQKISDIGTLLKLMADLHPEVQVIATGSSSFDLANKVNEPLTGRNLKFVIYPFSLLELQQKYSKQDMLGKIDNLLTFGSYPQIINSIDADKIKFLSTLSNDYLYRDALAFQNIQKPEFIRKLLKILAHRIGSEFSIGSVAKELQVDGRTIEKYIDILEKSFIIFRLTPFSRNLDKEIKNKVKIFFYDLGIRNSLIGGYQNMDDRTDQGKLWENFVILERLKYHQENKRDVALFGGANIGGEVNMYFWKLHSNLTGEIDLVEEYNGVLNLIEVKWSKASKVNQKSLNTFTNEYGKTNKIISQVITKELWWYLLSNRLDK